MTTDLMTTDLITSFTNLGTVGGIIASLAYIVWYQVKNSREITRELMVVIKDSATVQAQFGGILS